MWRIYNVHSPNAMARQTTNKPFCTWRHFRFEVGTLWHQFLSTRDGVIETSWNMIGDDLRQVESVERHLRRIEDDWRRIETGWGSWGVFTNWLSWSQFGTYPTRCVDLRRTLTSQVYWDDFWNIRIDLETNCVEFRAIWMMLRRVSDNGEK